MSKFVSIKRVAAAVAMTLAGLGVAKAADLTTAPVYEDGRNGVRIGTLTCDINSGLGYIIGSAKEVACTFAPYGGGSEQYIGNIKKLGVDLGWTKQGRLVWAVFAPTAGYHRGSLGGLYLGATAEATVVGGVGANVLFGGTRGSIALQPISVTGQVGLNVAAGGAALLLDPVN
ncbi:hypothetical protein K32_31980 [Kaistia sp. 32K]|uniref:DUF992 domain-containing protein n=1 Tax=Kaistia sp. 32K TaxID=2795690 RepID=UPI0019157B50|nr:DUF992 domain-containing protein [Kaistia sp. 32K]BCP54581.1 hypothetical protein K32_31980 [Kaistia sp. 32K]